MHYESEFITDEDFNYASAVVSAFANSNGGMVYLTPENLPTTEFITKVQRACQPPVPAKEVTFSMFEIPRSAEVHADSEGIVWVFEEGELKALNSIQIHKLASQRQVSEFECEIVEGVKLEHFNAELLSKDVFEIMDAYDMAEQWIVTPETHEPTILGVLFFTEHPQIWLPQARVHVEQYPTTFAEVQAQKYVPANEIIMSNAPLTKLFLDTWRVLAERISYTNSAAEFVWLFPEGAVHHALLNAFLHREYRIQAPLRIGIYTDCLEIRSPGGLPGYLGEADLPASKYKRNLKIERLMKLELGYDPHIWHGGLELLMQVVVEAGHVPPEYNISQGEFCIRLYTNSDLTPLIQLDSNQLSQRQQNILQYVQEYGSITERQLQALFPKIPNHQLQLDMQALVGNQYLLKLELKSGISYVLTST